MGTLQCKRPLTHTYTHHFISATSTVTGSEWIATICNIALTDTLPKGRPFFAGPPERKTSASLCVFNPTITHDIIQSVRHLTSGCDLFYTFSLHTPTLCCRIRAQCAGRSAHAHAGGSSLCLLSHSRNVRTGRVRNPQLRTSHGSQLFSFRLEVFFSWEFFFCLLFCVPHINLVCLMCLLGSRSVLQK